MCSISGFSFTPCSQVNARKVASSLLVAGRSRGTDASGFAYVTPDNRVDIQTRKGDPQAFVRSRAFFLPKEARTVICHTRLATQGHPDNERNNHPVYRFTHSGHAVAVVHNGCISNDYTLFRTQGLEPVAQVDSEILPAMLAVADAENGYRDVLGKVMGSVAVGWLDERAPRQLRVARAQSSPLLFVKIDTPRLNGVIFASTESMIKAGLRAVGLHLNSPGVDYYKAEEGQAFTFTEGEWDGLAHSFTYPKSYVRSWRSYGTGIGASTGSTSTYKGGTTSSTSGASGSKPVIHTGSDEMGEWGWWNSDEARASEKSVREADENAEIAAQLDDDIHRTYCAPYDCVLDDESHCPMYWTAFDRTGNSDPADDTDGISSFCPEDLGDDDIVDVTVEGDGNDLDASGTPADHYSDEEINRMAANIFILEGMMGS